MKQQDLLRQALQQTQQTRAQMAAELEVSKRGNRVECNENRMPKSIFEECRIG